MPSRGANSFTDRVVIVTGASSGLGFATARAFAQAGARVVMAARDASRLQQAATELNSQSLAPVHAFPCDVSDPSAVERLVTHALTVFGQIDILVNNAGGGMIAPFTAVKLSDAVALMQTNFFGACNCIQTILPHMQARRSGHIVNVASVGGLRGIPNISIYSASKAALIAFSESLRLELQPLGVHVTVFCTGRIGGTAFFDRAITYGKIGLYEVIEAVPAETAATALLHAIAKRKAMVVIPRRARLLHTVNKFAPRLIDRLLLRHMPKYDPTQPPVSC